MLTLTMRPYAGEADLKPIVDLLNACEAVDQLDSFASVVELRLEVEAPSVDPARDLRLWESSRGELLGFAQTWIPESNEIVDAHCWFQVHPNARGRNLEKQILNWSEQRAQEVGQERGLPVKLRASAHEAQRERVVLLENHGFVRDRYFLTMVRSLTEPIPEPQFPEGFMLRSTHGKADAIAWVEMFNQSFIDHWNHHEQTVEDHIHWLNDANYDSASDLLAIAPDGTFAAFCYCHVNQEKNVHKGLNEGWIGVLGTRRGFRRIGLGRAMLLSGLHRLKMLGLDTAKLGVDLDNPNQAKQLYESVGFSKAYTRFMYVKDV